MSLIESESLTYFCGLKRDDEVTRVVSELIGQSLRPDWQTAEWEIAGSHIRVSRRVFKPDSEFSRVILGMHSAVRRGHELLPGGRAAALRLLGSCDVMLGVVLTPRLADDAERQRLMLEWASSLVALVFDGQRVMDSDLRPVVEVMP